MIAFAAAVPFSKVSFFSFASTLNQDRTDMAMVYSRVPCVAAGTFTTNVVKAAQPLRPAYGIPERISDIISCKCDQAYLIDLLLFELFHGLHHHAMFP